MGKMDLREICTKVFCYAKDNKKVVKTAVVVLIFIIAFFVYITDDDEIILIDESGNGSIIVSEENMNAQGLEGAKTEVEGATELISSTSSDYDSNYNSNAAKIYVDVAGAVVKPGVVILDEGSRIFHAIDAAGGISNEGDATPLNLAEELNDGDKLYVPKIGEVEIDAITGEIKTESGTEPIKIGIITQNNKDKSGSSSKKDGKININAATSEELQTIPGIGVVTAEKIVTYRKENGKFQSIEDLLNVSGIGEKSLEKIIDYICV